MSFRHVPPADDVKQRLGRPDAAAEIGWKSHHRASTPTMRLSNMMFAGTAWSVWLLRASPSRGARKLSGLSRH